MVGVRKALVLGLLLIMLAMLAAPVLAAHSHPGDRANLTTAPGPDPSPTGPTVVDAATRAAFDAAIANDTSALAPGFAAFDSIGPSDSLQAAIDAAPPGSTIFLDPGIYYEHDLVVNKNLMIQANQTLGGTRENTIIDARGEGRIFTVESGSTLFLGGLTLRNGYVSGNGGAIETTGGNVLLLSSAITNCSATGDGGALYGEDGVIYSVYSAFSRCSVTGPMFMSAGGAIYSENGVVMVGATSFTDCSAPHAWGGAIEADSTLYVIYSAFTRCSAMDGGALDFYEDGAYVYYSTFTDCSATRNGGAMWYLDGGSAEVLESSFIRCSAAEDGGAIASDGPLVTEGSTFTRCSAGGDGGALYSDGLTVLESSTFTGCSAGGNGGAIDAGSMGPLTIPSSTFTGCSAGGNGGAIDAGSMGPLTIPSSTFTGCSAGGAGGAINSDASLTIISSTLTGNSAADGGAVSMPGSTGTISFSRLYQNTAVHGPSIYVMGDVNAVNNWWGTNEGPAGQIHGWYDAVPWLVLGITADPYSVTIPQTAYIRTNLTYNSDGVNTAGGGVFVPDAITNTYAVVSGPGIVGPATSGTGSGMAQTTWITLQPGAATISGTVDGQTVYVTLNAAQGTWTPPPTQVPNDEDWPQVGSGASGGAGGSGGSAAATGSTGFPLMTVTVNIGGNSKAGQATVTGTKLSELIVTGTVQHSAGDNVTAPPGAVYQYFSLVPARYDTVTNAVVNFTVPQAWLDENHILPGGIVLYRLTANGWEALPTTFLYAKDGTAYFQAQSAGFSVFAIAGTPLAPAPEITTTVVQEIPSEPVESPAPAAVMKTPVTTQTTAPPAPAQAPQVPAASASLPVMPAFLGIVCIGIIGGGWYARRWWIRRQNPALFEDF